VEIADGRVARLRKGRKTLTAQIVEPATAKFEVIPAAAPPPQKQQPGVSNLTVVLPHKVDALRLTVLLSPGESAVPADQLWQLPSTPPLPTTRP
jgi:hypothetical protein